MIALVQGVGQIQRGDSDHGPVGGWLMGADTVAQALADAIDDPDVAAILFRIDSGGGSAVASETIGREVRRAVAARQAGDRVDGQRPPPRAATGSPWTLRDRRRARDAHGIDRRVRGQAGPGRVLGRDRGQLGAGRARRQCHHVEQFGRLRRARARPPRCVSRPGLRGVHRRRGARSGPVARRGARDRPGPGVDRAAGQGARSGRRARRLHPRSGAGQGGGGDRPGPAGRAPALPAAAASLGNRRSTCWPIRRA